MDLLLFEPQLTSFAGHYNRYMRVIGAEAKRRGLRCGVVCGLRVEPSLKAALESQGIEVYPGFRPAPYRMLCDEGQRGQVSQMFASIALEHSALWPHAKFAWLSGTGAVLGGACRFAVEAKVPFVMQMLDFARDWPAAAMAAPSELREGVARATASGMRVYAQSSQIATHLASELDTAVALFPAILDLKPARPPRNRRRPIVGIMNMLRQPKQPWPAVEALVSFADRLSIVLHIGQGSTRENFETVKSRVESLTRRYQVKSPQIQVISGVLPAERYNAIWEKLDCTIMPYDVTSYRRQGSGILFESLADGIIPIAPLGSSMAAIMAESNVGIAYPADDPMALTRAVARLIGNFDGLARRSRDHAPTFREANSPAEVVNRILQP